MTSYRRAVTTLAAAAITGILAAGCGSDSDDDASRAPTDTADDATTTTQPSDTDGSVEETSGEACDIVSDDVAAEVLGVDIVRREGTTDPANGGVSCIKGTERQEDLANSYYVSVGVVPGGTSLVDEFSAQEGQPARRWIGRSCRIPPERGRSLHRRRH